MKVDKDKLKETLTDLQYHVTQENGTERPFTSEYNDLYEDGIYVDIVSGEALLVINMMRVVAGHHLADHWLIWLM